MVDFALQITLSILLFLTITWCMIVHYRLRRLRTDRGEMQGLIEALNDATERAEAAVRDMRTANDDAATSASERRRLARQQHEELARIVENAVRLVKRLDAAVEQGATQAAELRTNKGPGRGMPQLKGTAFHESPKCRTRRAAVAVAVTPASTRLERAGRPMRQAGQLHGELQEALQALR